MQNESPKGGWELGKSLLAISLRFFLEKISGNHHFFHEVEGILVENKNVLGVQAGSIESDFGLEQVGDDLSLGNQDIRVTIARIIRAVLGFLGIVALLIVLYGGFVYMTAGGEEQKVATAKKILVNGVIGLAIILSAEE